jgi:hypothetical protein
VDPQSLTLGYQGVLVAVGSYDQDTGLAVFPLPDSVPALVPGAVRMRMIASDFQEAKNIETGSTKLMPNTRTAAETLHVVARPAVDWLAPASGTCVARRQKLVVAASAPGGVSAVRFAIDRMPVAVKRAGDQGVWTATISTAALGRGAHTVTATAVDGKGRTAVQRRKVRVCRR